MLFVIEYKGNANWQISNTNPNHGAYRGCPSHQAAKSYISRFGNDNLTYRVVARTYDLGRVVKECILMD